MRKLVKISIYIAVIFVVGMLSGYITFFKLMGFNRTVNVPDLIGKGNADTSALERKIDEIGI